MMIISVTPTSIQPRRLQRSATRFPQPHISYGALQLFHEERISQFRSRLEYDSVRVAAYGDIFRDLPQSL